MQLRKRTLVRAGLLALVFGITYISLCASWWAEVFAPSDESSSLMERVILAVSLSCISGFLLAIVTTCLILITYFRYEVLESRSTGKKRNDELP